MNTLPERNLTLQSKLLEALYKLNNSFYKNLSIRIITDQIKSFLEQELKLSRFALIYYEDNEWNPIFFEGANFSKLKTVNFEKELKPFECDSPIRFAPEHELSAFSFVIPILHKKKPIAYLLISDNYEHLSIERPCIRHTRFITHYAQAFIMGMENKRLFKENSKKERFKTELNLASKMQLMLVKSSDLLPNNDTIEFFTYYKSLFEIGGDFYDACKIDEQSTAFCIADVSGKGVSAALLMSNLQANLNALFQNDLPLPIIIEKLNSIINNITQNDRFVTLFLGCYRSDTKTLRYINAGHNPPVIFLSNQISTQYLEKGCAGIGMLDDLGEIEVGELSIPSGSKLICFTDGVSESHTKFGLEFGHTNFVPFLNQSETIQTTVSNILAFFKEMVPSENIIDDTTIFGVGFK